MNIFTSDLLLPYHSDQDVRSLNTWTMGWRWTAFFYCFSILLQLWTLSFFFSLLGCSFHVWVDLKACKWSWCGQMHPWTVDRAWGKNYCWVGATSWHHLRGSQIQDSKNTGGYPLNISCSIKNWKTFLPGLCSLKPNFSKIVLVKVIFYITGIGEVNFSNIRWISLLLTHGLKHGNVPICNTWLRTPNSECPIQKGKMRRWVWELTKSPWHQLTVDPPVSSL